MYHKRDGLTDTECADKQCRLGCWYIYTIIKTPLHRSAIGGIVYHERDGLTDTERADEQCRPVLVEVGPGRHGLSAKSGPQPAAAVAGTENLSTDPEHSLAPE